MLALTLTTYIGPNGVARPNADSAVYIFDRAFGDSKPYEVKAVGLQTCERDPNDPEIRLGLNGFPSDRIVILRQRVISKRLGLNIADALRKGELTNAEMLDMLDRSRELGVRK